MEVGRPMIAGPEISAIASNRPTEALASVISFTFVVYSHYKHSYSQTGCSFDGNFANFRRNIGI